MSTFADGHASDCTGASSDFACLSCVESEGLCYQGYVDIFDAGPTLEANSDDLRAVKESHTCASKLSIA
jgi:arginine/ornithine N-succinyltransferase beta subunit